MQNIEQFVMERQEIKPLQTCESYFLTFPKKYAVSQLYGLPYKKPYEVLPGHRLITIVLLK